MYEEYDPDALDENDAYDYEYEFPVLEIELTTNPRKIVLATNVNLAIKHAWKGNIINAATGKPVRRKKPKP